MRNTIDILGVPVDHVRMRDAVSKIQSFLDEDQVHTVYTPNAEIMMAAHRDPDLKKILCAGDMVVADGAGVVLASKILRQPLPERVAGFDLTKAFFAVKRNRKVKCFLFGGKPGVAETAAQNIMGEFPRVEIAGCQNGYFSKEDETSIIQQINSSGAEILLVALGAPKQEKWIHEHKSQLNVRVCIGVGGSLDVFAGEVKRAPEFFQKHSLEWLYRLYKEPWRFKRMLDLPLFIFHVFLAKKKDSKKAP